MVSCFGHTVLSTIREFVVDRKQKAWLELAWCNVQSSADEFAEKTMAGACEVRPGLNGNIRIDVRRPYLATGYSMHNVVSGLSVRQFTGGGRRTVKVQHLLMK